jgi:hypothetical protein
VPNSGLRRLRDSLNAPARIATWQDAARQAQPVNGLAFPDYGATDWEAFARRTYAEDPSGRPIAAYDPSVLNGLNETDLSTVPPNLRPLWTQLGSIPTRAIRGGLSDILSADILTRMAAQNRYNILARQQLRPRNPRFGIWGIAGDRSLENQQVAELMDSTAGLASRPFC